LRLRLAPVAALFLMQLAGPALWAQGRFKLSEWQKGIRFESPAQKDMAVFLWFYEWNMFDAIRRGAHTNGTWDLPRQFSADGREAVIRSYMMRLTAKATSDGADLALEVTNHTDNAWAEVAGVIPCFNPGRKAGTTDAQPDPGNPVFGDLGKNKTWFLSPDGLTSMENRAIHFNGRIRPSIDKIAAKGPLPFSDKWPTSPSNAAAGIILRESDDEKWITAIAWEDFLSVQAHNPWHCMHLCVRVGPLEVGRTKTIRGKVYLFRGTKEDCLKRFQRDFAHRL
jgi:hypothetical protein